MINEFIDIMRDSNRMPSPELVEQLAREYPYFWLPSAVLLQRGGQALDATTSETLKARVAINAADSSVMFRLTTPLGTMINEMNRQQPPETPSTTDAIDTFLERYGAIDPAEEAMLERLIFNPTPSDYSLQIDNADDSGAIPAADDCDDAAANDDSLESIIAAVRNIRAMDHPAHTDPAPPATPATATTPHHHHHTPAKASNPSPDSTFSESLAKIYIKQQRFDKALEIISGLYLKFPEKSVYFADQIRFLQKLILNRSYNSQQ